MPIHEALALAPGDGGLDPGSVVQLPRVPTELELGYVQGFPDDWTRWDDEGNEIADSPRYRMMGNAVAVPVAEWIGRRIMAHVSGTP